jgi:protein SCO1/2
MRIHGTSAALLLFVVAGLATAAVPKALPKFERVLLMDAPRTVGDVALTDQNGAPRKISDFAGAPAFVFFGFTHCPDVCPTTLKKLALIKSTRSKELKGVRVLFVSVDGERDTPEAMKAYLQRYSPDFTGLTAPSEQVRNLALSYSAAFFKDAPKDGEYLVQHSTRVYALDKKGRLRAEIYDASPEAFAGIGKALLAE